MLARQDLPAGLRLVSRHTGEYAGPCPFCHDGNDRFRVWLRAAGRRPAGRYWCRVCGATGLMRDSPVAAVQPVLPASGVAVQPVAADIVRYRALYAHVAAWAARWLWEPANPGPLAYVRSRGLTEADVRRFGLGFGLADPLALPAYLARTAPDLMSVVDAAGVLARDRQGQLRTHPSLCGAIVFPTVANGLVVDLRGRRPGPAQHARSLPGSPAARGALWPAGWDAIGASRRVILTESGEFKTLVPLAAFLAGVLDVPTIGFPGLFVFQPSIAQALVARGVRTVVIAYDARPRQGDVPTVEEGAAIRYGALLADAGLEVRVARLPLAPGAGKADLDGVLLAQGPAALQRVIDSAPLHEATSRRGSSGRGVFSRSCGY